MVRLDTLAQQGLRVDDGNRFKEISLSNGMKIYARKEAAEVTLMSCPTSSKAEFDDFFENVRYCLDESMPFFIGVADNFCDKHALEEEFLLEQLLAPYAEDIVQDNYGLTQHPNNDGTYVELILTYKEGESLSRFASSLTSYLTWNAKRSTKNPNYSLDTQALASVLSASLGQEIHMSVDTPANIVGYSRFSSDVPHFPKDGFVRAIVQPNGSSFTYDSSLEEKVFELTKGKQTSQEKSRAIYEWVVSNVSYDNSGRRKGVGYRSALETFLDKKGICGESAALLATMERLAGNRSFLADILDFLPQRHACVMTLFTDGSQVFIDPAHKVYGASHKRVVLLSDEHSLARYD